jgi:hypothetical protein
MEKGSALQIILPVVTTVLTLVLAGLVSYVAGKRNAQKEREATYRQLDEQLKRMDERLGAFELRMREMNLLLLKCVITNKELSLTARFDAYDAYKAAGGNGWVERYVVKHLNDTDGEE